MHTHSRTIVIEQAVEKLGISNHDGDPENIGQTEGCLAELLHEGVLIGSAEVYDCSVYRYGLDFDGDQKCHCQAQCPARWCAAQGHCYGDHQDQEGGCKVEEVVVIHG